MKVRVQTTDYRLQTKEKETTDTTATTAATPHQVIQLFSQKYENQYGMGYPHIDGKDHRLAKTLLVSFHGDLERIGKVMDKGFSAGGDLRKFMDTFGGFYKIVPSLERQLKQSEFCIDSLAGKFADEHKLKPEYSWKMKNGNYVKVKNDQRAS